MIASRRLLPSRSMRSICPDKIFNRATSRSNHSARSTSGKARSLSLLGGHSISKVLLNSNAASKSASPQKASRASHCADGSLQRLLGADRSCRTELFSELATGSPLTGSRYIGQRLHRVSRRAYRDIAILVRRLQRAGPVIFGSAAPEAVQLSYERNLRPSRS